MGLISELISKPQRETAGSNSANAFDYQKDWALAQLLEYHLEGKDYVFIFEFHDDIVILNSEDNPTLAEFVQIKTSTKNWTINRLTTPKKDKDGNPKLSILGKLYSHKCTFSDLESKLHFITNAVFSFKTNSDKFNFDELENLDQQDIKDKINVELESVQDESYCDLFFTKTNIPATGHEIYLKGALQDFFARRFGDNHTVPVNAIYKTIADDIKIKNNYSANNIKSIDDLYRNKCLTKSYIDSFLLEIENGQNKVKPSWNLIEHQLITMNYKPFEIIKIQDGWAKYSIERLDSHNKLLQIISDIIQKEIEHLDLINEELSNVLVKTFDNISDYTNKHLNIFCKEYIIAIILWKYCEAATI